MKKIIIIVSSILAVILLAIAIVLAVHGMFSTPVVMEKEMGPYYFAYEDFTGDYSKTMPAFDSVYNKLQRAGVASTVGIGIYLDNPSVVPAEKLRSKCGSVYELKDSLNVDKTGLKKDIVSYRKYAVIKFPIKSFISYMVGPVKCYPAFSEYFKNKGMQPSEGIEIYDMKEKTAYYLMSLPE